MPPKENLYAFSFSSSTRLRFKAQGQSLLGKVTGRLNELIHVKHKDHSWFRVDIQQIAAMTMTKRVMRRRMTMMTKENHTFCF